ncbi:MAG: hypothetical protein CL920_36675 [Deltaproteobacteria bacterium]|nr:hypothetical protein [Deltaproteobacteria bacterium]MBU54265.1 hypothetical protein [Deltaproteobacteria bacterium]|tara:strand:+ start:35139 stop:37439 length:2301 start_codon:yes stop_codon:yes gene_type:complete
MSLDDEVLVELPPQPASEGSGDSIYEGLLHEDASLREVAWREFFSQHTNVPREPIESALSHPSPAIRLTAISFLLQHDTTLFTEDLKESLTHLFSPSVWWEYQWEAVRLLRRFRCGDWLWPHLSILLQVGQRLLSLEVLCALDEAPQRPCDAREYIDTLADCWSFDDVRSRCKLLAMMVAHARQTQLEVHTFSIFQRLLQPLEGFDETLSYMFGWAFIGLQLPAAWDYLCDDLRMFERKECWREWYLALPLTYLDRAIRLHEDRDDLSYLVRVLGGHREVGAFERLMGFLDPAFWQRDHVPEGFPWGAEEDGVADAIAALGDSKEIRSLPYLYERFLDALPQLRNTLLHAIGEIGETTSIPWLQQVYGRYPEHRYAARDALFRLGELSTLDDLEAELLTQKWPHKPSLSLLSRHAPQRAWGVLSALLKQETPQDLYQRGFMDCIRELDDDAPRQAGLDLLTHIPLEERTIPDLIWQQKHAPERLGDPGFLHRLVEHGGEDLWDACYYFDVLVKSGLATEEIAALLVRRASGYSGLELLVTSDVLCSFWEHRKESPSSLEKDNCVEFLQQCVGDGDPVLVVTAIETITRCAFVRPSNVALLRHCCDSPFSDVRYAALRALASSGTLKKDDIVKRWRMGHERDSYEVVSVLVRAGMDEGKVWLLQSFDDAPVWMRRRIPWLMRFVKGVELEEPLRGYVDDDDPMTRLEAVRTLVLKQCLSRAELYDLLAQEETLWMRREIEELLPYTSEEQPEHPTAYWAQMWEDALY